MAHVSDRSCRNMCLRQQCTESGTGAQGRPVHSPEVRMTVIDKGINQLDDDDEQEEAARIAYAQAVGARLRTMRKQMRLSLQAVEAMSEQEFKASVLGAYERGERAISVPRLQRLAKLYDVPVDQLLPPDDVVATRWGAAGSSGGGGPAQRPAGHPGRFGGRQGGHRPDQAPHGERSRAGPAAQVPSMIQVHRQDFNGRMITIRAEDVRAIACLFGVTPDSMGSRLDELGLLVNV